MKFLQEKYNESAVLLKRSTKTRFQSKNFNIKRKKELKKAFSTPLEIWKEKKKENTANYLFKKQENWIDFYNDW